MLSSNENALREWVEKTAYMPAVMRALESVSPNRLIYDSASLMLIPSEMFDAFYDRLRDAGLKKTFIDFHAFRARAAQEITNTPCVLPQTVILGAGLDTLVWREHQLKDVYEIDQSDIFLNKVSKLPKPNIVGKHILIQADLTIDTWDDRLLENGYNPMLPTVWIMEGLLYYCTKESTKNIFQMIDRLSTKNSRIFFDHWPSSYAKTGLEILKLFRSFVDDPIEEFDWFIKKAWNMTKMIDFSENGEHYGRHHETFVFNGIPLDLYFVSAYKVE